MARDRLGGRIEKRLPISIVVNLAAPAGWPAQETELTYTENVSDHGACIVSGHPWQLSESAQVTSLPDQVSLRGKVVHCHKCDEDRYAIGLRFQSSVAWPAYLKYAGSLRNRARLSSVH